MKTIDDKAALREGIKSNLMTLVYFGGESCNVCQALRPKVEELLQEYPKIRSYRIDVDRSPGLAAANDIFTIPAVLVYVDGKETVRAARHVSLDELRQKLDRYYGMLF